jgi:hypothetical protein
LTGGKTPLERVYKLLSKLDSIRRSKERGSLVSKAEKDLSHKFMGQVEYIFKPQRPTQAKATYSERRMTAVAAMTIDRPAPTLTKSFVL